ncbi:glycosyltransferase [bacterium 1xD8-6]|nr:glycosyltransferase [bacterium D16-36]RKI67335.1 glycosyltransferase [bacterium 1xD8-6]
MEKKKVSIMIPCYNEEENVVPISDAVVKMMEEELPQYNYEILFIDNDSSDNTRTLLREICEKNKNIKAIFNAKNFGQFNSPYHAMCQTTGDCTITMCCDFQDPVEMIPKFIKEWENGYKIVCGIKASSRENPIMRFLRTCYYKLIKKMSDVEQIEHFTGFGLYDKSFIKVLKDLDDPVPFIRGIVAELGYRRKDLEYEQPKRRAGKTHNNWYSLYDAAMLSFTSYTKVGLRIATIFGFFMSVASIIVALVYLVLKLMYWNMFPAGTTPILLGIFVFGSVQIFFIGLVGEYIMNINTRVIHRPLVIEEERINFEDDEEAVTADEDAKTAIDDFKKIHRYMHLAKKEDTTETYAELKKEYLSLKAILNIAGVNLTDIDEIKE